MNLLWHFPRRRESGNEHHVKFNGKRLKETTNTRPIQFASAWLQPPEGVNGDCPSSGVRETRRTRQLLGLRVPCAGFPDVQQLQPNSEFQ